MPEQPDMHMPLKAILMASASGQEKQGSLTVYSVKLTKMYEDARNSSMVRVFDVGQDSAAGKPMKVMMVLGATGSGKTTFLNGLFNFLVGVTWEDKYRFTLIVEDSSHGEQIGNQAHSQTSWVTAYRLHWQEGFQVAFSLMIIDTPGYGDTRGIERDRLITKQIQSFFGNASVVDQIDMVGFVAQASLARLTPTQGFIFDSILSLFGKDIQDNITVLSTFADANKPPVENALKAAEVPYNTLLKFNNSALFADNQDARDDASSESDDDGNASFNKMFWDMGQRSFGAFAKVMTKSPSKSLQQTRAVLSEREQIELTVVKISDDVQRGLNQLETIRQEIKVVQKHQADIEANRNFTYTVNEVYIDKEDLPVGRHVTNCLRCNLTCHNDCLFADDNDKQHCAAMRDGNCTVCTGKCHWTQHKNMLYKLVVRSKTVKKDSAELKAKYEAAQTHGLTHQQLLEAQFKDFETIQTGVLLNTNTVRKSLERLAQIALRKDPLSHVDYIDQLIRAEEQAAKPGFNDRIQQLQQIRRQADQMERITAKGYDPFKGIGSIADLLQGGNQSLPAEAQGFATSMVDGLRRAGRAFVGL